jgi:hypothetical protein
MTLYSRQTKGLEVRYVVTQGMDEATVISLAIGLGWTCEFITQEDFDAQVGN